MFAVHGFWSSRRRAMCLWAEDSELKVTSRSQAVRRARPHPFAVPADQLADLHPGKPSSAILLLPSLSTSPLDSPELVRVAPRPEPRHDPALAAWTVPILEVDPAAAFDVVDEPAETARYGASVRFLSELAAFARELTDRGQLLPTFDAGHQERPGAEPAQHVARWRAVLQGPDAAAVHDLVAAMPPVCRAETDHAADTRGQKPTDLATDALHALVDAAVRRRLSSQRMSPIDLVPARRGRRPKRAPVVESWLTALTTPDGRFDADTDQIAELERLLAPWAGFGSGQLGPARAAFRLAEVDDDGRWRLEFLLQSVEDPSLLVPAEQVWTSGGELRRWLNRPDELLLAELGRASAIYPAIGDALRQARPTALELDTEGTHDFLATKAGLLDQAGFGVQLPSWWNPRRKLGLVGRAGTRPTGTASDQAERAGGMSREALCQFEWKLAIGDEELTEDELAALAATKAPLVRLRGTWVTVDHEQLRRGLEFLRRESGDEKTAGDVIALATTDATGLDTPLPVTSIQADGTLGELLTGRADQTLEPAPPPGGLHATLRDYQRRGLSWLAFLSDLGLGACLADDMGLGKTIQLLSLELSRRSASTDDVRPTLLVCTMSLVGNWQREAAKFAPALRLYAHHGRERLRGADLDVRLADTDIVITTYTTVARDLDELAEHRWDRVVVDEAQAIKNRHSQAARAVRRLDARHRVALTGTPMENRLSELWSIMDFLNPGMLGSSEEFRARYAIPVERYGQTEPAERLRTITRPYILRRLKTDKRIIQDLPEKIEIKQYCRLTTEQGSLYQSVVDDMMEKIENSEGIERRGNVLATMAKLKQVCNHPAQLLHDRSPMGKRSGKVLRLEEILDEILAEGDKVLCFTQFTEFAEMLMPHLAARFNQDLLYLHGGTPRKRRDEMVARFQSDDGPSVFLLSLKAGGTGLNLTAASHVIHLDRWWNPAVEDQATDRAFRIGQRRNVEVHKFICTGTLEEKIDDMIEQKKALTDLVISDGERWLTELSTGALREVFALSEEAVGE
ncbi:DEAD/DEAH box helicase [Phytoactinopolyspora halotolerans]|uniref:DEAD/DEAH box helicase n=1 Tax=Phytoactinopolyspora halotolerans TaxID=1981512 RepID=A0A6L9RZK5_9ACTN|nr:DEAD/DEAH box helicase [Phytoactinopolyspora halotolerans]NED98574.1 DEAD/DEAH box helicase [Phytoactinopolyspora halotolerans]